uniref:Uncharacterized protein n=1 Tax=Tanacetum cinerariifolium TaxID=118510 RepID=A0A699RR23_TANCI|nr:hypothetical protein [Tanacetum cinerariifolium]
MSTPMFADPESSTQADRAQSSRVSVQLPEDPYEAIMQAYLVGRTLSLNHLRTQSLRHMSHPKFESRDAEDEGPTVEDEDPAAGDEGLDTGVEGPDVDDESYGLGDESHGVDDESRGLDDEGRGLESDGLGLGEEEAVPEG